MSLIDLPPELILLIADLLNVKGLSALIRTSRHLARLLDPILQDRALTYRYPFHGIFKTYVSVFELAAFWGNTDTLQKLLTHVQTRGSEIPQEVRDRALYFAVTNDDTDLLEFLVNVAGADISAPIYDQHSWESKTALHWAAEEGCEAAVQKLIEFGANVNAVDEEQLSALHLAVRAKEYDTSVPIAKLLLEKGAMIEARAGNGATPLHKAALDQNTPALKLLLDYGADVTARDSHGMTALHYAIEDFVSVVLLVERGCDLDATDNAGRSPRELALTCLCGDYPCGFCQFIKCHGNAKDNTKD